MRFIFRSPQDIDLFTGALTETAVAGGGVGPTLDCLLGDQFGKLKFGDRFWYQGVDNGFTSGRLAYHSSKTIFIYKITTYTPANRSNAQHLVEY